MDSDRPLFSLGHHLRLLLQTSDNSVHCVEEILFLHHLTIMARCNQGCLVTYVSDVGSREARRLTGQEVDINAVVNLHRLQMHLKYFLALIKVRQVYMYLTVETTSTKQGRVEHVSTVRSCENDYAAVGSEAVHLCQQGIKRVFALVIAAHGRIF